MEEKEDIKKPVVACYDADFIMWYICPNKKGEPEKTLEDCINMCDNLIYNMNKSIKADYYVGFLTVGKCFRYTVNPQYKANRKYENPPNYLSEVKEHLKTKHNFTWDEQYESDDLVMSFKAQNSQYKTIIVSPDKDILGAVDIAYNPRKNEFTECSLEQIEENFWKSMITGDSVDGIKGIPGKGESFFNKNIMLSDGMFLKKLPISLIKNSILDEYIKHFGEYKGIQEFYRNYMSLKMVDNVELKEVKLNEVTQTTFCE